MHSLENPVPTDIFVLPGQQFCFGLPEKRAEPRQSAAPPLADANTLDESELGADPCAGWEIGPCEVIRRLTPGGVKSLLAVRTDPAEGQALVVLRHLELPELSAEEVVQHARWASLLRHPHLGRVFPCEVTEEGVFWVTELDAGATLAEISAACRKVGKAMPIGLALAAVHEVAVALAELHAPPGVAHGLVSNKGVVVSFDGGAKLLDVGLFRCLAQQSAWKDVLESMGPYFAPEQVLGGQLPDLRSDVFSLGMVLYECLSGENPRRASDFEHRVKMHLDGQFVPPSSLNVALGKEVDEVVLRALSPHRSERYPNAQAFARALRLAAAAFMWRADQRARFVGELFRTRKRREQVLLSAVAPRRSRTDLKRSPTKPETPLAPKPLALALPATAPSIAEAAAAVADLLLSEQARPAAPTPSERKEAAAVELARAEPKSPPLPASAEREPRPRAGDARRSRVRPLTLALAAAGLGWVAQADLRLDLAAQSLVDRAASWRSSAPPASPPPASAVATGWPRVGGEQQSCSMPETSTPPAQPTALVADTPQPRTKAASVRASALAKKKKASRRNRR
ncbi:MAG: protein kinase [Myxococcales bacterium]|nr:protein kinase [Myxococcales bacterium]